MDPKSFRTLLREQLELHGMNLKEFSAHTGVSERHLEAFLEGHFHKLPAAPYVRGYLIKIAHALDLEEEQLWELYREEVGVKSSGAEDRLPQNRYAIKTIKRSWIVGGAIGILVLVIAIANIGRFVGAPNLTIVNPALETTITSTPTLLLEGTLDAQHKLTIDGEEIPLTPDGAFQKLYLLEPGPNQIRFTAKKFLGKEVTVERRVVYEPVEEEPFTPIP